MGQTAQFKTTSDSTSVSSTASARSSKRVHKNKSGLGIEAALISYIPLFERIENTRHKLKAVALISKGRSVEIVIQHIDVQAESLIRRQLQSSPKDCRVSAGVVPRRNKRSTLSEDDLRRQGAVIQLSEAR